MKRLHTLVTLILLAAATLAQAGPITIQKVTINDLSMNKRMLRMNDNGLVVDQSGIALEVTVNFQAAGLMGRRIICDVAPLAADGSMFADSKGTAAVIEAVTVPSNSYSGKIKLPLPYSWIMTEETQRSKAISLSVTLACIGDDEIVESKDVLVQGEDLHVDGRDMGKKMMGQMLGGGSSSDGGGMMGALLGGLLDTSDAESTQTCPSCDGTGVCAHCDGDGFFDPSVCRKCANDPGICRRCKGEGTVTVKIDIY